MDREGDPSTPADSETWLLQNCRLSGGKILSRGGQTAVNTVEEDDCIRGIFDAGDGGAISYGFPRGGFQAHTAITYPSKTILTIVTERVWSEADLDINADNLVQFTRVTPDRFHDRVYADNLDNTAPNASIHRFKGTASELEAAITKESDEDLVYGSAVIDDVLYFLAKISGGNTRVYSWDGTTKTLDETLIDTTVGPLYAVGDELYCYGTTGVLWRDSTGTWAAEAYPTDTLYYSIPVAYNGLIYFAGQCTTTTPDLGVVDSFNGSAISRARTLPEIETGAGSWATATCVFNGKMYVAWGAATYGGNFLSQRNTVIAEYDGTTWTDQRADFDPAQGGEYGPALVLYTDGADLYLVSTSFDTDDHYAIHEYYHSSGPDTTTWTKFRTDTEPSDHDTANTFTHQVPVVLLSEAAT
jgi:hypothetical protein